MRPTPYIGVTGIKSGLDVRDLLKAHAHQSRKLMLGFLVSLPTLNGETHHKHSKRYMNVNGIKNVMSGDERALNLIHFETTRPSTLLEDMRRAQALAGPLCHGFQLNMPWPSTNDLFHYRAGMGTDLSHRVVVLQCGPQAMKEVGNDPKRLAIRVLENYRDLVDYVLVDGSQGEGKQFDERFATECLTYLNDIPSIGLVIGGGLEPMSVHKLHPLLRKFPHLSWDAEGRLHNEDDEFETSTAIEYVEISNLVCSPHGA